MRTAPRVLALAVLALAVGALVARRSCRLYPRPHAGDRHGVDTRAHFAERVVVDRFLRGNLHAHSLRSDGTAPIEAMVAWYRDHGYRFLAMSEHDVRVDPGELAALAGPGFVIIAGEEVTDRWQGRPLHVNALCARHTVEGNAEFPAADVGLAEMFAQIRAEGGIPLVNHPNFHQSLTADDVARGASGRYLLEIWSGHPDVAPGGDATRPSAEALWDVVLAGGGDAIPAAVDDAHQLPDDAGGGYALPGRAWVETFGDDATATGICEALAAGRLYASNGPVLARIAVEGSTFSVTTADPGARVAFLGAGGEVLAEGPAGEGMVQTYRLDGREKLVRARVADALGRHAWTAAYRVER